MKKQHENLISVLLKSFFREIKPFPLIFIIAIISLFFIGGYNGYRSYTSEKNLQNAQELYGDYTLSVNYLSFDEVDKIKTLCADYETVIKKKPNINNEATLNNVCLLIPNLLYILIVDFIFLYLIDTTEVKTIANKTKIK